MTTTEIRRERAVLELTDTKKELLVLATDAKEILGYNWMKKKYAKENLLFTLNKLDLEVLNQSDVNHYKIDKCTELNQKAGFNQYGWEQTEISEYRQDVPEFVLNKAIEIKREAPDCRIVVEHIANIDPFLVVQVGHTENEASDLFSLMSYRTKSKFVPDEQYFIEVWDEPKFEGRIR